MPIIRLTAFNSQEAGFFYRLTDAQLRSRQEPEKGVFIAEGPKVVRSALEAGLTPLSLLMREKMIEGAGADILAQCGDVPVFTGSDEVLSALTGFKLQRSWVLCAMRRPKEQNPENIVQNARRIAVLENITEPSNVGAIFRSAAALGADAILLSPSCCDPLHRRAVRVCMGSVFRVPWARLSPGEVFPLLRANGFTSAALALRENCLSMEDTSLRHILRLALFLGTEDTGLAQETIDACDAVVKIPMRPGIDSLNVAAAAAIAFWATRPMEASA